MAVDQTLTPASLLGIGARLDPSTHPRLAIAQSEVLPDRPILSIVIPALNEEGSIAATVRRCLAAAPRICAVAGIAGIEVVVVSDGSTDRTAAIAQGIAATEPDVRVIVFEKNRGYGAAIKEGFRQSSGRLLAFLDADGTCDPDYFGELCEALLRDDAAIALGSRMGAGNEMPRVRRLGNHLYALLLGSLSGRAVSDTASGMRVLRRSCLEQIYPLPDGLHFTPAMSARALLSDMRIVEVPMSYAERVGESKLRVLKDGIRFLVAIANAAMLYRPGRVFGIAAVTALVVAAVWGAYPLEFYLTYGRLEEWMVYRVLLCGFLGTCAFTLVAAGVLSERVLTLVYRRRQQSFMATLFDALLDGPRLVFAAVVAFMVALVLVWPGVVQYATTGHIDLHWARAAAAMFLLQVAVFAVTHAIMQRVVALWQEQLVRRQQR